MRLATVFLAFPLLSQTIDPAFLNLLEWRQMGPSRGGRVLAVTGDPADKLTAYFGATGGGVWKTEDGGWTWRNISDGFFKSGAVGAIAVAPSDPKTIYVGMGESCFRGNAAQGDGVYKSTDGGRTWSHIGLKDSRSIARIRVHPKDPNTVWVAAFGDGFGPNPERGVFKSVDGGATWKKTLYRDDKSGAIDLTLDPANPKLMYASLLQFRRYPWANQSGGAGSGLFKSVDGGDTWTEISNNPGLPTGLKGRIGLALSPARPDRVWAIIDAETGKKGVFRTDDGGATWTRITDNAQLTQRPWYYHHIFADPKDPEAVYVLNIGMWKSTNGGKDWQPIRPPHGDHHDLWIDPNDPLHLVQGNDGGATISFNGGRTWSTILNQPTAQMYHVITDNQYPYRIYGAQQDNSSISLPAHSDFGRVTQEDWWSPANSESGYIAVNRKDPSILYVGDHHWTYRYDKKTNQTRDISPNPETHYGWGARDINFRFQWTFPVVTSKHDPNVLYVTSQFVHRSTNEGQSWQVISPDLTRADKSKLEPTPSYANPKIGEFWGPITRDNTGVEWYSTVFAFAESPVKAGVLWTGSDDGFVHVSQDNGRTWQNVTPKNLPEFALISILEASPHDPATAYIAATRYKLQDRKPYLLKTSDYGKTWTLIHNGIPDSDFTRVIREDPARKGLLYAGTESGVYVSVNDGANWQPLRMNLPVAPVHDLVIHRDAHFHDVIVATHGRGFWILDGADRLAELIDRKPTETTLLKPKPALRLRIANGPASRGEGAEGPPPPRGALIQYFLKSEPQGPLTLTISDANGQVIQTYSSERGRGPRVSAKAGANSFNWNLQYPAARVIPGTTLHGPPFAPLAPSGEYQVTLNVGGQNYTEKFRVVTDPRVAFPAGQLQEQFSFLMAVRDKLSESHDIVRQIRETRNKAEQWAAGNPARQKQVQALNDQLYPIEERLTQYRAKAGQDLSNYPSGLDNKLTRVANLASMGDAPPTQQSYERFKALSEEIAAQKKALDAVLAEWRKTAP